MTPPFTSPSILVARFLRSNNYSQTLSAFISEAGLPEDAGLGVSKEEGGESGLWTIERVLEEKRAFDITLKSERLEEVEEDGWSAPAPSQSTAVEIQNPSNILSVSVQQYARNVDRNEEPLTAPYSIIATAADRRLSIMDTMPGYPVVESYAGLVDSPILSCVCFQHGDYMAMTTMSGKLVLLRGSEILNVRHDHKKYAVQVVVHEEHNGARTFLATAGWDAKIFIYCLALTDETSSTLSICEPIATISLTTNPECILFMRNRETADLILLVSRCDSTNLYYYLVERSIPAEPTPADAARPYECKLLGKQNLAPHSNAWVAFSPSFFALNPRDPEVLAVATSSLPHLKLMIIRLLIPCATPLQADATQSVADRQNTETQATQALAALAIQNREDAAILVQANTMAPQTAYSTPQVVWRPDGSGVWVNGDDGEIRGIEAKTGKVVTRLRNGHEPGSKVRTLWAGWLKVGNQVEEWVLSGGFDKKLVVWKACKE
ncbi:hypothetical protein AJ80_02666 [Polytolypa hystricis UAMH7299]|uniref:LisH domain-containing protein n=1 Tax=Polytolypa hystricis (strain UAMH7299) TaxID=1447883 RepID=A0A2B7YPZ4_POLH7|nr:hypothetical protein AJ80_02666 [Polytolypa hystricis UAMH7299]